MQAIIASRESSLAAAVLASCLFITSALASDVQPGIDCFVTPPGGSDYGFGGTPIPPGFFDPGSDAFADLVRLGGLPIDLPNLGDTDTIVERVGTASLPSCGAGVMDTVPIRMVALSLVSVDPITVTYGGGSPELWDMTVTLDQPPILGACVPSPPCGTMTITHDCMEGGFFDASLGFDVQFIFDRLPPAAPAQRVLPGQAFQVDCNGICWVHNPDPLFDPVLVPPGVVNIDTDGDGVPDTILPGTSNFFSGVQPIPCNCGMAGVQAPCGPVGNHPGGKHRYQPAKITGGGSTPGGMTDVVLGFPIPDGAPFGVSRMMTIPTSGIITDVNVRMDIAHPWVGDLRAELTHIPSGMSAVVFDRPGVPAAPFGCDQSNVDCLFDDLDPSPVEMMCNPGPLAIGPTARPETPFSVFNGQDVAGNWMMVLSDLEIFEVGTFTEWSLEYQLQTPLRPHCTVLAPQGVAVGAVQLSVDSATEQVPAPDIDIFLAFAPVSTFMFQNCTGAPTSPNPIPLTMTPTGRYDFEWDTVADGIGLGGQEQVMLQVQVVDFGPPVRFSECFTIVEVDNNASCTLCGDCNGSGSGVPDILDSLVAAQIAVGLIIPTGQQPFCCDTDNDGDTDIIDALRIAQVSAGIPVTLLCP